MLTIQFSRMTVETVWSLQHHKQQPEGASWRVGCKRPVRETSPRGVWCGAERGQSCWNGEM